MRLSAAWGRVKDQEVVVHVLIDLHDTCLICASVAVIGCREDSDDVLLVTPIEAIHHQLMCARDKLEVVHVVELLRDILSEGIPGTSGGNTPACAVIGVRPQEIAHGSLVGNFLHTVELPNLIEAIERW